MVGHPRRTSCNKHSGLSRAKATLFPFLSSWGPLFSGGFSQSAASGLFEDRWLLVAFATEGLCALQLRFELASEFAQLMAQPTEHLHHFSVLLAGGPTLG